LVPKTSVLKVQNPPDKQTEFLFSDKIGNSINTLQTLSPPGKEADFQQQKQRASLFFTRLTSLITALKFSLHQHLQQFALALHLHGIEEALTVKRTLKNGRTIVTPEGVKYDSRGLLIGKRAVVRYADDFVCFCETEEDAQKVVQILAEWLKERGLSLNDEKTKIVHLTKGFDFLGFNVRHYRAKKTSRTKWKLLIKPSKESVQEIRGKLKEQWLKLKGRSVATVIKTLNPRREA